MSELKELQEQFARGERERKNLEENFHLVVGPYGSLGKEIKELKRRITNIEQELARRKEAKQNRKEVKQETKEYNK